MGGKPSVRASNDERSEFERDYDRAVFSTPVRRLQDKAQVFPLEPHDAIRTRLTHSLEVSSFARGLATQIGRWLAENGEITADQVPHLGAMAAACGLLHDIGNPPFGHAGEIAIREWFKTAQNRFCDVFEPFRTADMEAVSTALSKDFLLFDGNAQTMRLITKLQVLADEYGLNLTCGTLSAAMKYIAGSGQIKPSIHQLSKLGMFQSEAELLGKVREEVGLSGHSRHPITYLVESADDAAYAIVDLEDGVKKEVISWQELATKLKNGIGDLYTPLEASMKAQLDGKTEPDKWVDGNAFAQAFRVAALGIIAAATRDMFKLAYPEIIAGSYDKELVYDDRCQAKPLIEVCKKIGGQDVYPTNDILRLELRGRRVVHDLMDVFWEGAKIGSKEIRAKDYPGKTYKLISKNYRWIFEREMGKRPDGAWERYLRLQLVTDYVTGMTDGFACSLHANLFNG